MMFETGQQFAHFKVIRKLGEGGMGEVYLAEDQKLNRRVALKILRAEFFDSADRMERFNREARTAAQISHPNVMAIYDIDSAKEEKSGRTLSYIVLEYVKGVTLTEYLQNRDLTIPQILRVAEKIASGLAAAHKLNIVHRDIKLDNIKIDDDGEPKILDFGLAKPVASAMSEDGDPSTATVSRQLTVEGKILGTLTYMSPEQARGESVDGRSDIFSFGVLAYRMFAGVFPFEGPDRVSVLAKTLEARHIPVRQKNEAIPAELERIIDKCLRKDANDRYQDTRDLVVDLRSLRRLYDSDISDTDSTIGEAAPRRKKTGTVSGIWKIGIAAVVVAALALIAYQAFVTVDQRPAEDDPLAFLQNLKNIEGLSDKINETLRSRGIEPGLAPGRLPGMPRRQNALAILGFENKTGDTTLNWLQSGLPEILSTDLAEQSQVDIISRSRVLDCLGDEVGDGSALPSHKSCVDAARSLGASKVLSGSFYRFGEMLRIDARLEDVVTGKIVLGEKVVGNDPFVLVDSLTHKIALSLGVSEMMAGNTGVSEITSSSPEAYKEYILGMEKFSRNQFEEAIGYFEKAINIDSTFALPYMRIGMAHALRGRDQGMPYFAKAIQYENNLPTKERNLLDIYADLWLQVNFDDAFVKMETYISNYPDDKEGRAFYAILLHELKRDSEAAIAQLDTVMMLDPKFLPALHWYMGIYSSMRDYENAIRYAELAKQYYPGLSAPYNTLMNAYLGMGRPDDAIKEGKELLEIEPDNYSVLSSLSTTYIRKRDFKNARVYIEKIKEYHSDDPYLMIRYYRNLGNLAFWEGRFSTAMGNFKHGLEQAKISGDSSQIASSYSVLADLYLFLDMPDSALVYGKQGFSWGTKFQDLDYPLLLVMVDPENEPQARTLLTQAVNNFKSRVPAELWPIMNSLEKVFNGYAGSDTNLIVEGYRELLLDPGEGSVGNSYMLGKTQILSGHYEEGREVLEKIASGQDETSQGFFYLTTLYYIGVADEELGNREEAIASYREVLKYWDNPEIELKEIKDIRRRLDNLVS